MEHVPLTLPFSLVRFGHPVFPFSLSSLIWTVPTKATRTSPTPSDILHGREIRGDRNLPLGDEDVKEKHWRAQPKIVYAQRQPSGEENKRVQIAPCLV